MNRIVVYSPGCLLCALLLAFPAEAQVEGVRLMFMEPEATAEAGQPPTYRLVTDPERAKTYTAWTNNEAARMALELYQRAWRIAHKNDQARAQNPVYYIALVPEGNHADVGFRLRSDAGQEAYPHMAYVKLDPDEPTFRTTLLHETGHVLLYLLNGGMKIPGRDIASIPHTTAALTDRGTAFSEGFAIHLETLAAHLTTDPAMRDRYHHQRFLFGPSHQRQSEYFRHSIDLLTYSQSRARYYEIRENNFAFAPAFRGPDYLRVQLDKSRDFATLRDANQLLQSEGFYASFFFSFLLRGERAPTAETIHQRQDKVLATLAEMFRSRAMEPDAPYLLYFVETHMQMRPAEAGEAVDVLLDLSHGVFVDRHAATLWRDHYLGALRLDLAERNNEKIAAARSQWRTEALKHPNVLSALLGPQIRCEVPARSVMLVAFGEAAPLSFDVNTVEEGIMRLIPGITDSQIDTWLLQRRQKAFSDVDDFKKRAGLSEHVLARLKF